VSVEAAAAAAVVVVEGCGVVDGGRVGVVEETG